jgi:uncharacterized protein YjiS (DUF1127 family)
MIATNERFLRERETGRATGRTFGTLAWHAMMSLVAWTQRTHERRQLLELDDRMLKDIGLNRGDVERECAKPFWRP